MRVDKKAHVNAYYQYTAASTTHQFIPMTMCCWCVLCVRERKKGLWRQGIDFVQQVQSLFFVILFDFGSIINNYKDSYINTYFNYSVIQMYYKLWRQTFRKL